MTTCPEQQLNLFSAAGFAVEQPLPQRLAHHPAVGDLDDEALIAAIPTATLGDCTALAAEAARRRLAAAIPALEALCRRFTGFGIVRVVPEQSAALQALAVIGSRDAAQAVSLLIVREAVQGPTLCLAVTVAAQLHATLPVDVLRSLLRHADPDIRANACRCACRRPGGSIPGRARQRTRVLAIARAPTEYLVRVHVVLPGNYRDRRARRKRRRNDLSLQRLRPRAVTPTPSFVDTSRPHKAKDHTSHSAK